MSLNGHVPRVWMPVWGGAGPSLQFNFVSLCGFYKLVEQGAQVGAHLFMVAFTGHLGKSSIPTLFSLNWGVLGTLNTVCVIWWIGQGGGGVM